MGLDELHKRAEWYSLPDNQRTSVQRLAARTRGVVTPANGISVLGALLTLSGLFVFYNQHFFLGLSLVGIGRICDILDGHVARKTRTTGPFGEGLDAGLDKIAVVVAFVLLVAADVIPLLLGGLLVGIQMVIAGLALKVWRSGTGLHPTRAGKYAMFGLWLATGLFMVAHALPEGGWASTTWTTAFILMLLVVSGELEALREYWRAARRKQRSNL